MNNQRFLQVWRRFFPPSKTTNLRNEITNFQQRFDESFSEAWDKFKDLLRACPHHGFSELHQLDTFYNALNSKDQDSLNSTAGGNFLDKMPRECLSIIESKSKVRYSRNKPFVVKVSTTASTSGVSPDVAELKDMMRALLLDKKGHSPAPVKVVVESCVTCGGAHSYKNCPATDGNNYRDNIQEFVSQAFAVNFNQRNIGIDNDIYSTVDACPNAREMWKAIDRLKQGESSNVQDLETNLYWEFGKFTSQDGESLESYYLRFYKMMNELIRNQCKVTNHQVNVQFLLQLQPEWQRSQQAATRNRGKAIVNSLQPIYDQEPSVVAEDDETSKDKEIDKLMALISLSFKKIYKPTNNNLRTSSNTSHANQDNSPRINRNAGDDTDDDELEDQELEAHYMHMAQLQEVSPDAADSGPIFDYEPLQKVSNDDHYNVFAMKSTHPEQSKSVHDTYPIEQDAQNVIINSLDMNYDKEEIDQDDDDNDLSKERELLASLIKKLKCEIDERKNRNKFLETSNKVLIENLKGEIEDFKNKNKSLESSNNYFKEANNKLSETNNLLYTDYKKSEAELTRRNTMEYASQMEIECAKVRGDFLSYKMEYQKSCSKYTQMINDLNQMISEMKDKLSAHQETISILSQQKEAQIKLYKTREDKELDKVIALENKVKVMDNIVYKTGQSVQTMNMLYNKCQTSFAKPEFLKKAQRANPRLYDIGCYNDNLALMLAPESDELVEIVLFIVDSGCSKHMTRNLKLLINFMEKFLGTVKFGNDQIAPILGYGDLVQGAVTIKRVYYVEGLNHNLFFVSQFCDADLEVAFRKSTYLYSITLQDTNSPNPICLMAKATSPQARLWHRRLSHLNFDTINLLTKNDIVVGLPKLKLVKDRLCSSFRIVRTNKGTEFMNKTLHAYFASEGINHQTSVARTPEQNSTLHAYFATEGIQHQMSVARTPEHNGIVERRNRTLVKAARTMRWENLDKMKEKGDKCIFVGYSNQSRAYRVFNKRTRVIMESIHVNFDKLLKMASDQNSSDRAPECQTMALNHDSLSPKRKCQENVSHGDKTVTKLNELDLLFSPMFDELLNGLSQVVSKSSAVTTSDESIQRQQQQTTSLVNHTTPDQSCQVQSHELTVTSNENINQAEWNAKNDQVADDEFINVFSTLVQDRGETSNHHVHS
nr:reverse transcriptase domain-containing protein [Tanacetum cinerariifolium]